METDELGLPVDSEGSFTSMGLPNVDRKRAAQEAEEARVDEGDEVVEESSEEEVEEVEPLDASGEVDGSDETEDDKDPTALALESLREKLGSAPQKIEPPDPRDERINKLEGMLEKALDGISGGRKTEEPEEDEDDLSIYSSPAIETAFREALEEGNYSRIGPMLAAIADERAEKKASARVREIQEKLESTEAQAKSSEFIQSKMRGIVNSMTNAAKKSPVHKGIVQEFFSARQNGSAENSIIGRTLVSLSPEERGAVLSSPFAMESLVDGLVIKSGYPGGSLDNNEAMEVSESSASGGRTRKRTETKKKSPGVETIDESELFGEKSAMSDWSFMQSQRGK